MIRIRKVKIPYFITLDVFDEKTTRGPLSPDAKLVLVYMYRCEDLEALELDTHVLANETLLDHERVLAAVEELQHRGLL
ncbi:MAG: hypothetical protein ABSA82_05555 [Thermacetogeniaceae bacterium]|jgi:hypothetical protein